MPSAQRISYTKREQIGMKPAPVAPPLRASQTRPERRRANRQYQKVIDANRRYFDARSAVERPLLEHIHTSRRSTSADSSTTADVIDNQVAEDQGDTVFSRSMADVIASDGKGRTDSEICKLTGSGAAALGRV